MPNLICELSDLPPTGPSHWKTVAVHTATEPRRTEYLKVPSVLISLRDGKHYIPVAIAVEAPGRILVELPAETDSGARRVWVPHASLVDYERLLV